MLQSSSVFLLCVILPFPLRCCSSLFSVLIIPFTSLSFSSTNFNCFWRSLTFLKDSKTLIIFLFLGIKFNSAKFYIRVSKYHNVWCLRFSWFCVFFVSKGNTFWLLFHLCFACTVCKFIYKGMRILRMSLKFYQLYGYDKLLKVSVYKTGLPQRYAAK